MLRPGNRVGHLRRPRQGAVQRDAADVAYFPGLDSADVAYLPGLDAADVSRYLPDLGHVLADSGRGPALGTLGWPVAAGRTDRRRWGRPGGSGRGPGRPA